MRTAKEASPASHLKIRGGGKADGQVEDRGKEA